MYEKLLTDAGLTKNEAKVYLALLRIGKSKSGKIVGKAGISGGKVYETLNKLIDKGLVEISNEEGIKVFSAADPESILLYMEERKDEILEQTNKLSSILPELQKIRDFVKPMERVYLIKGMKGIRPLVYGVLREAKSTIKIMGLRSTKDEQYNIYWEQWHLERIRLNKKAKLLSTDRDTPYWNFFKKLKLTNIRYIHQISPCAIMIIDNHTFILSYEDEFTCIHIFSEHISKSFSSFFDGLWEIGKN